MRLDTRTSEILARLRRVEGQIRGIQTMIDDGRECTDVVTQFAAALGALQQAGFAYFAATMAQCALDPERASEDGYTQDRLEKMFLQLA